MNPCELTASITAIANLLANCVSEEELTILAVSFTQLGDTLSTILAQRVFCDLQKQKKDQNEMF